MTSFKHYILITIVAAAALLTARAADKHDLAGPKGGRLLGSSEPRAEFYVEPDRSVSIYFYDSAKNPVPAGSQDARVIADTKDGKISIEFENKGQTLVSKRKLPDGDGYNVVVQLKRSPEAKPQNYRFKLDLHQCGGCQRVEYACSCHE